MECNEARRRISDRLDAPLDAAAERALGEHLSACAACRAEEGALVRLDAAVRGSPSPAVPPGLAGRVASAAAAPAPRRSARVLLLPIAAAAAAVAIFVALNRSGDTGTPGAPPETVVATSAGQPEREDGTPGPLRPSAGSDRGAPVEDDPAVAEESGGTLLLDEVSFEAVETLRGTFGGREDVLDALDRAELFLELAATELEETDPDLADIQDQLGESGLTALFQALASDPAVEADPEARDAATEIAATLKSLAEGG